MPSKSLTINRRNAYLHFFPECNGKCRPGWVLHHIDPSWKTNDRERYDKWYIEDLVPMTKSDHMKLHSTIDNIMSRSSLKELMSPEDYKLWKQHISEGQRGTKHNYPEHRMPHSEETKQKMSKARSIGNIGKHWYTNGVKNTFAKSAPDETWHLGRTI